MERLTKKKIDIEKFSERTKSRLTQEYLDMVELNNKLCEYEDFMKEQGFESLEDLKSFFKHNLVYDFKELLKEKFKIEDENQALKDRWQKLTNYLIKKEKTKVTKFAFLCRNILDKMQELEDVSDKGEL